MRQQSTEAAGSRASVVARVAAHEDGLGIGGGEQGGDARRQVRRVAGEHLGRRVGRPGAVRAAAGLPLAGAPAGPAHAPSTRR